MRYPSLSLWWPSFCEAIRPLRRLTSRLDDLFHDLQLRGFQPTRAKTRRIPHTDILVLTIQDLDSIPSVSVVEVAAAGIVYHTDKLFQERVIEVGKKFIGERVQLSDTNCAQ